MTATALRPRPASDPMAALSERRWVTLTGAGMSTASGIPDYRGPDGTRRVQPMTIQQFRAHPDARRRYWARSHYGWRRFTAARPNPAHRAVTELQRLGVIGEVITQNVDGLHTAAGTTDVIELHGSLAQVVCEDCTMINSRDAVDAQLRRANPDLAAVSAQLRPDGDVLLPEAIVERFVAPRCPQCRSDRLRPDVVFFGDSVPAPRVEACFELIMNAEGLLVLGSSLAVMSGLRFVRRAARRGIPIMIITRGPTRGDDLATHRVDAALESCLAGYAAALAGAPGTVARPG